MFLFEITHFTIYLFTFALVMTLITIADLMKLKKTDLPPTPFKLPILGHLHLLAGYQVPFEAFTALSKKFGDIFKLKLGYINCVVINGDKNIREALVTKGHHFDARPDFQRYHQLFSGSKENSLAFCNWSDVQKIRRDMLKVHTFPRAFTNKFRSLEEIINSGTKSVINLVDEDRLPIKTIISRTVANIFTTHFCDTEFDLNDSAFTQMVENYDDIFFEVNQGYAADFLPFLLPFYQNHFRKIAGVTHNIREFVLSRIIRSQFDNFDINTEPNNYVESLIQFVKMEDSQLTWDSALFALEDIIGGHSAVANFLVKLLAFLAKEPQVQWEIQKEIDTVIGSKPVSISDKNRLPYTEAAVFEAIRLIASPIVPRVANCNSSINGFPIQKGTMIFLNNYELSISPELWQEPTEFKPERFIREGRFCKPEHFLPFGGGRRSCMGYKMVQLISFAVLGSLLQTYTVVPHTMDYTVPVGSLALPKKTFTFNFKRR